MTGLEGVPVFEVSDGLFDSSSDFSGGSVADLVRFGLGWACWFLGGGDHSQPDIAFVPNMHRGIKGCEESGLCDGLRIMNTARQRWGDPGEVSGQGAGHLQVHPRRAVFA